mmetsp:Transcript_85544/g.250452  ORF Transcript_85544/g.250452 Transcript_85544/m.250452 type:complete len:220 (+) Transcript_85544:249-908(+)
MAAPLVSVPVQVSSSARNMVWHVMQLLPAPRQPPSTESRHAPKTSEQGRMQPPSRSLIIASYFSWQVTQKRLGTSSWLETYCLIHESVPLRLSRVTGQTSLQIQVMTSSFGILLNAASSLAKFGKNSRLTSGRTLPRKYLDRSSGAPPSGGPVPKIFFRRSEPGSPSIVWFRSKSACLSPSTKIFLTVPSWPFTAASQSAALCWKSLTTSVASYRWEGL